MKTTEKKIEIFIEEFQYKVNNYNIYPDEMITILNEIIDTYSKGKYQGNIILRK